MHTPREPDAKPDFGNTFGNTPVDGCSLVATNLYLAIAAGDGRRPPAGLRALSEGSEEEAGKRTATGQADSKKWSSIN